MLILTLRTDRPLAEFGLYQDHAVIASITWEAHRKLAETLHNQLHQLLADQGKELRDIQAIACYQGPGSFTGLRIGMTVANAIAYSLGIPMAAIPGDETDSWKQSAISDILAGNTTSMVAPEYGSPVHITAQKK